MKVEIKLEHYLEAKFPTIQLIPLQTPSDLSESALEIVRDMFDSLDGLYKWSNLNISPSDIGVALNILPPCRLSDLRIDNDINDDEWYYVITMDNGGNNLSHYCVYSEGA